MTQTGLFPAFDHQAKPAPLAPALFAGYPQSVRDRFARFHEQNPQVYELFRDMAAKIRQTGRARYSARTIIEAIRWTKDVGTRGDAFQINDNYTPLYVRLLISERPEFAEFFELRVVRSKGIASQEQREREHERNQ